MTRVAVVGVGAMGRNHARVYTDIPDVQLTAVVDADEALAQKTGVQFHVPYYTDYMKMVEQEKPDAISVVVPTSLHFSVVKDLLEAGCNVLVEKPIAATLSEAQELVGIAQRTGKVLMVGHIERFNPAIVELKRRLNDGELGRIFQIHTRRLGPFPTRIQDVGVIMDLAPHDLDVMRHLLGNEVSRVFAETKREVHTSQDDLFAGMIRFEDGTLGVLEINWVTPAKIRELYVTGERGMFRVNYITQDLCFYENADMSAGSWPAISLLRGVSEGVVIQYAIRKKEPLRVELESFILCVQGKIENPVNGQDAMIALRLVLALMDSAATGDTKRIGKS
jgi:predicted dehydrogenase